MVPFHLEAELATEHFQPVLDLVEDRVAARPQSIGFQSASVRFPMDTSRRCLATADSGGSVHSGEFSDADSAAMSALRFPSYKYAMAPAAPTSNITKRNMSETMIAL